MSLDQKTAMMDLPGNREALYPGRLGGMHTMKRAFSVLWGVLLVCLLVAGCTATSKPAVPAPEESTPALTPVPELPLPDAFPVELVFSSGAGGWSSAITLNRDGSFQGTYHDSEMGEQGPDYPDGTVYLCDFSGQFDHIQKENDTTYSMTLSQVISQRPAEEEWVDRGVRYVASIPYGLEQGKDFLLYTPDTAVAGLSEEFLSWWPQRYLPEENTPQTLTFYGLYNEEMGYGFFGGE